MDDNTFIGDEPEVEPAKSDIDLIYETSDGYITVATPSGKTWEGLCRALETPEWLEDPRFLTPALRQSNLNERLNLVQEALRRETSQTWLVRLEAADVPCAPVLTRRQAIRHPQVVANGTVVVIDHPSAGRLRQARPAARFSDTPTDFRSPAPQLGEHTRMILGEAEYSETEIDALAASGVVYATH